MYSTTDETYIGMRMVKIPGMYIYSYSCSALYSGIGRTPSNGYHRSARRSSL